MANRKAQYLYRDGDNFTFMDMQSYEQHPIPASQLAERADFLREGMEVDIVYFEDRPISVDLPIKVVYEVIETEPGVRGDTAQGGSKPAKIETGAMITVPLFINQGDKIYVNTQTACYLERA